MNRDFLFFKENSVYLEALNPSTVKDLPLYCIDTWRVFPDIDVYLSSLSFTKEKLAMYIFFRSLFCGVKLPPS